MKRSAGARSDRRPPPPRPPVRPSRRWRAPGWVALAGGLGLALAGIGWLRWQAAAPARAGGPDVLLVTIDTLRADHVGCYGMGGASTPTIDAVAARGARFAEAVAQVPLTLPSHASILTGVTPLVHGVRDNAGFVLGARPATLAEALALGGYATAAFVSGFPVHHRFGLSRGFSTYDDRFPRGDDPTRPPYVERRADDTVAAATAWLARQSPERPVFVWLHLFDPHAPYDPPEPYRSRFRDRPYDGEIAFADEQLGVLLSAWRSRRHDRDPLIVITSDHGEGLGEHGEPTHGLFIYDSTIRVPLVLAGPGVPAGKVVTGAVRSIDIAPTVLDLSGQRPMAAIEGRTLRPALARGQAGDEPAYAESLFGRLGFGWAPLYGWRDRGVMFVDAPRPEVYDLRADPGEQRNLAAERGALVARMKRAVDAAVTRAPDARPSQTPREAGERLRSLGYVSSGPIDGPTLRDPKDFVQLAVRVENGIAMERSNPAKAEAEFRAALAEDPANVVARRHLAMALVGARHFDAAITELKRLLDGGDDSLETLTLLGESYRLSGRQAEALEAFTRAVTRDGAAPEGFDGRGKVLTALGRTDEARRAFEQALQVAPDDPEGLEGLADLAIARGDMTEASSRLEALSARDTEDDRVALKHGVVLVRLGEVERAIGLFKRVVDREPGNAEAAVDLGGALAKSGRPADAVPYLERAVTAGARGTVVWNSLGVARLESGDRAGAAAALRESLRAAPDQPAIRDLLDRIGK